MFQGHNAVNPVDRLTTMDLRGQNNPCERPIEHFTVVDVNVPKVSRLVSCCRINECFWLTGSKYGPQLFIVIAIY